MIPEPTQADFEALPVWGQAINISIAILIAICILWFLWAVFRKRL